jgi:hypothetical protein
MKLSLPPHATRAPRLELEIEPTEARPPRRERMPPPPPVDFSEVEDAQWPMHRRLENWAAWSRGDPGGERSRKAKSAPMFRLYRSSDARREYGAPTTVPVNSADALAIHFAILRPDFDPLQRGALQWCYLRPRDPARKARDMGVELGELRDLVRAGRQALIDMGL